MTSAGLAAGAAAGFAAAGFAAAAVGFVAAVPVSASATEAGFLENHAEMPPLAGAGSSFFLNMFRILSLPVDESTMKSAKMTPERGRTRVEKGERR